MSEDELKGYVEHTGISYEFFEKIYSSKLMVIYWDDLDLSKISINHKVKDGMKFLNNKLNVDIGSLKSLFKQGYIIDKQLKYWPKPRFDPYSIYHCVDARENAMREDGLGWLVDQENKKQWDIIAECVKPLEEKFIDRWSKDLKKLDWFLSKN